MLIYGPPASGKLTVARALAERYDLTLLDNHLTFDVALRVFDFGTPQFNDLVERLRVTLLESMAAERRDSVATYVFSNAYDRPYVDRLAAHAARFGIDLQRVQLCPLPPTLEERVVAPSRATTQKIRDLETLRVVLKQHDLYTPIDEGDLRIDNSAMPPEEVAAQIAAQLQL